MKKTLILSLLTTCCFYASAQALAQQNSAGNTERAGATTHSQNRTAGGTRERGPDASVVSDPDKMVLGSFVVNPALSVSEYYDDNIFYTRVTPTSDMITVLAPSLSLSSDWDKHELNFHTGATIGRYQKNDRENYEDYFIGFDGHYDLAPKSRIFGGAQYNKLHEGRESPDDVLGTSPTEYSMTDIFVGGQHEFDAFGAKLGLTMQDYNFDDVATSTSTINNDDRDRQEYELGTRLIRPWTEQIKIFAQGVLGTRNYDSATDDNGLNRDSDGYSLGLGALYRPQKNLSVEVLAGGLWQEYDDPSLPDISRPDFGVLVGWAPSPYTGVNFSVDRRVRETTLSGASGYVSTKGEVSLHHDLTREMRLGTGVSFTENEYEGVGRTDELLGFYANNRYYFTPQIYGALGYDFLHRDSDQAGQGFYNNRVMFRLGAHLNEHNAPAMLPSGIGSSGSFFGGVQEGHGTTYSALDGPRGAGGTVTADFGDHGTATGLFAGYDHFFGSWFMGAEADIEQSSDFELEHIESNGGRVFDVSRKESYGLSLRGGYRQPNNVAYYGRAGLVQTGFDTDYTNAGQDFENDDTHTGFRFGGGIEAPVNDSSLFVRMDYSYATYEDFAITLPSGTDTFNNSESIFRLGLMMRTGMEDNKASYTHEFSGPYLGGQVGYGGFATRNRGARNAPSILTVDRAGHGGTGGLFGGYGIQPLDNIYLGVEGEAELSYADWNIERDPTGRIYGAQKDWTVGGALRAGYIFNDVVMLYGRAGGVLSQIDTDYARGATDLSQKDTLSGLRYGVGMEVGASDNMFVRMDYSYTDYDEYNVDYGSGVDSFNPTESMMRIGVGYRF